MDRSKWEYKKLGEVCTIFSGFTPKPEEIKGIGKYPYFKVADMNTSGNERELRYTLSYLEDSKKFFKKNSIVFPKNGAAIATNKKRILAVDSIVDLNTAGMYADDSFLFYPYLYYYILNTDFKEITRGGAIPTLDLKELKSRSIYIPLLSDQKRIVAELDCLNEMIALKQEQLKEFDKLAQSIFYDMFGGDTYSKLELASLYEFIDYRGKTPNKIKAGIPLITARNIRFGYLDYSVQEYISEDEFETRQSRGIAKKGDLLFTTEAPIGFAAIADLDVFSTGQRVITFQLKNGVHINNLYMLYYLMSEEFQQILLNNATGVTVKGIKAAKLKRIKVSIPPLALQQQFAEKIQAIEAQKVLVKKSIAETQQLLDSRMDYYFD